MNEDRFWELIENSQVSDDPYEHLTESLRAAPADDIVAYQNILREKIAEACTFPILAANFVIQSYVSDDVFEDFRAWLVSKGRERFENAVSNPETIASWLERDEVDDIDGATMLLLAETAFAEYWDEDQFFERIEYPSGPNIEEDWPDTKAEYRERYPALVDKFWNQERISELHAD